MPVGCFGNDFGASIFRYVWTWPDIQALHHVPNNWIARRIALERGKLHRTVHQRPGDAVLVAELRGQPGAGPDCRCAADGRYGVTAMPGDPVRRQVVPVCEADHPAD